MPVVRDPERLKREWLGACEAFLSATLVHARYLRASGRLRDPESSKDIELLEAEHDLLRRRLTQLRARASANAVWPRLPQDPGKRLSLAARRELRSYRDEVCADSRRLRARSAALVRRSRAARWSRDSLSSR